MTRPRSPDFDAKRRSILVKVRAAMAAEGGPELSFRQMAVAAGVSVPTLRHYVGSRTGLIEAVLADWNREGQVHLDHCRTPTGPLAGSMFEMLMYTAGGFMHSALGQVHMVGLASGLGHAKLGPAYLTEILEPTLASFEGRLAAHLERGELRADADLRLAALSLAGPLLVGLLHQTQLGGAGVRPLDVHRLVAELVRAFTAAYGASDPTKTPARPIRPDSARG